MTTPRLIEIRPDTHDVEIDLVYATDRNLTGKPIYRRAHCRLLGLMHAAGFEHIASEWWHYALPGSQALPVIDNEASGLWRLM